MNYTIVGAGIAGLAFARQLQLTGQEGVVYERRVNYDRDGLGFIVLGNGVRCLETLGLDQEFYKIGAKLESFELYSPQGHFIKSDRLQDSYGVRRRDFLRLLCSPLPKDWCKFGANVTDIHEDHITIGETEQVQADLIVAADGARSRVRTKFFPEAKLTPIPIKEIVSFCEAPDLVRRIGNRFIKTVDHDRRIAVGCLPCSPTSLVWYVQFDQDYLPGSLEQREFPKFIRQLLYGNHELVHRLIDNTDYSESYLWHTADLTPMTSISKGNVVLLGDAGHAFSTFTSQGLNSALEDGILLANLLKSSNSPQEAASDFFQQRKETYQRYYHLGRSLISNFFNPKDLMDLKTPLAK